MCLKIQDKFIFTDVYVVTCCCDSVRPIYFWRALRLSVVLSVLITGTDMVITYIHTTHIAAHNFIFVRFHLILEGTAGLQSIYYNDYML